MRILVTTPYYKPFLGGTERVIERLTTELKDQPGVEAIGILTTRVYFPRGVRPELPAYEKKEGIEIYRSTFWPASLPRVTHIHLAGYFSWELPRILREFRPDVMHFFQNLWWSANLSSYLLTRRIPHLMTPIFHDEPWCRSTLLMYSVNRWLLPRMDAVHVLSEAERDQVQLAFRTPRERIVVIPPGVDWSEGVPDRSGRSTTTILAVGRLMAHKGQLKLVQMIKRLTQEQPGSSLRLILVGDDGGDRAQIEAYVAEHGLGGVVTLMGHVTDEQLPALYQEADLFALPTLYESYGLVFTEAMAHGLPVVTFGAGPISSILTAGAVLIAPDDDGAFFEALKALINDPESRRRLGREARECVALRYTWRAMGERLYGLYSELTATHRERWGGWKYHAGIT